jgi:hypothetical protein
MCGAGCWEQASAAAATTAATAAAAATATAAEAAAAAISSQGVRRQSGLLRRVVQTEAEAFAVSEREW